MKWIKKPLLLKNQLMLYFILISFIPLIIINTFYYINSKKTMEESIVKDNYRILSHVMDNIENEVMQANKFLDWVYTDDGVIKVLNRTPNEALNYDEKKDKLLINLDNYYMHLPIMKYVNSMFLIGENGIDIRRGEEAFLIEKEAFERECWYKNGRDENGKIIWGTISRNYTKISNNKYIIPQTRVIKDLNSGKIIGQVSILFSDKILEECYKGAFDDKNNEIYIVDKYGNIFSSNVHENIGKSIKDTKIFSKILEESQYYFHAKINNDNKLILYKNLKQTDWYAIEVISMEKIKAQQNLITHSTVVMVVVTVIVLLVFSIFISTNLTKPVNHLIKKVNLIAEGNFNQKINLNNENEIGYLGKNIEKMSMDIHKLMMDQLRLEEEKRKLEMKMLHSQINPHFLYNTLNSIKLMATMQGAASIGEMTGRLGRLLKETVKDIEQKVTVAEEISILEDYIYIQRIKYKGRLEFTKEIKDEKILNYLIIKFIFQPLVENSIFHGIEPKRGSGKIKLAIEEIDNKLLIDIWDDGIGMNDEQIKELLCCSCNKNNKGIGFENVNKRIKLIYGDEYGLNIDSVQGEYTKVSICIPIEENNIKGGA